MKNGLLLTIAALFIHTSADARGKWGPEELKAAGSAAYDHFEKTMGADAYQGIRGFSIQMRSQKNAATVKITYVADPKAGNKVKSLFCHNHGATIDCH